ncbi:hypothetical protein CK203_060464 [Vitis vinifera]|uniref:Uncharacterized protein n=1 Tax=Vitis vinifera TaxID=29760 RepID=A0A438GJR5_VITVI|nr:hypothetical protein CK203_060464 [Vitis vinifera]
MKRFLDLNEMEELRNDAYNNSNIAKQRLKRWHDQLVSRKEFQKGQKVLLYDSKLHIFSGKLKSRWIGPFTIQQMYSNGIVELLNSTGSFKVNGQHLKPFLEPCLKTRRNSTSLNHIKPEKTNASPCEAVFLSIPHTLATNLKRQSIPLTPFWPWRTSEEAIPTLQYFVRPGQAPPLLRIHLRPLRPRPVHLPRAGCPLALLSTDTRHGHHQLLQPLSH